MPHEEVDDTDMTPAEFRAAAARGIPVRMVTSREEYEAELGSTVASGVGYYFSNRHLTLAFTGGQAEENMPARAAR